MAGLTPTVAAWLVEETGDLLLPAYYLMVAAVIGIVTSFVIPETANKPLRGDTPNASNEHEAKALLKEAYENIEETVSDIEEEISAMEAQLEALRARRQRLVDRHPHMD